MSGWLPVELTIAEQVSRVAASHSSLTPPGPRALANPRRYHRERRGRGKVRTRTPRPAEPAAPARSGPSRLRRRHADREVVAGRVVLGPAPPFILAVDAG